LTGSQIEVRRFSYRYPQLGSQWALRNIEAQINAGEYVLLCGASGSGKSTLCGHSLALFLTGTMGLLRVQS